MRLVGLSRGRGALLGACLAAIALAGCSSGGAPNNSAVTVTGNTLAIYAAKPLAGGQAATDVLEAEQLAFAQSGAKAGKFTLALHPIPGDETSAEARTAVSDDKAIAYLGEIEPGASGVSLQITNELGLLQISPTDTAAYLTQKVTAPSGASSTLTGSPGHWYPASSDFHQTFARVVPTTAAEASALVKQMQAEHLRTLAVGDDGTDYGVTVAQEVKSDATAAGMTVTAGAGGADAYFFGGSAGSTASEGAATKALDAAVAAGSQIKLFAPSGLYDTSFVSGLSRAAQAALTVSSPGFMPSQLNAQGTAFETAFEKAYDHTPAPQAIFGYEAMKALVAVLTQAGAAAASRSVVASDFRSLKRSQSALGSYTIKDGDTTLAPFVMATVAKGRLVPHASQG